MTVFQPYYKEIHKYDLLCICLSTKDAYWALYTGPHTYFLFKMKKCTACLNCKQEWWMMDGWMGEWLKCVS